MRRLSEADLKRIERGVTVARELDSRAMAAELLALRDVEANARKLLPLVEWNETYEETTCHCCEAHAGLADDEAHEGCCEWGDLSAALAALPPLSETEDHNG